MKRLIILCISFCLLTGCGAVDTDIPLEIESSMATESAAVSREIIESEPDSLSVSDTNAIIIDHSDKSTQERQEKLVAFTFDDGPGDYTAALLDGLAERGAKATFFISTNRVSPENSYLIRRMDTEGHEVANHTVNHPKLHRLPTEQIKQEVADADAVLRDITGKTPLLLRPPYGNFTTRVLEAIDKPAIVWSIDTRDCFDNKTAEGIRDFILERIQESDIILLHEWGEYSRDGTLLAMDALSERGYRFVTVPELFAAKSMELRPGNYYAAANGKDFEERLIFDADDPFLYDQSKQR